MNDSPRNARILIVDDTLQNIQVLGTILKGKNYQINVAQNGIEVLDMVERARPDLILLDVMMPEMDGFETCRRLKNSPDTRDIPIIFLTAKTETDDVVKELELGGPGADRPSSFYIKANHPIRQLSNHHFYRSSL